MMNVRIKNMKTKEFFHMPLQTAQELEPSLEDLNHISPVRRALVVGPWHAASLILAKVADESEIIVKFKGTSLDDSCCKIKSMPRRETIFFINDSNQP